jgi:putative ABC transport system permease protein
MNANLRFAVRSLLKARTFTAMSVVCLALATSLACIVAAVFFATLRPNLPYRSPGGLVQLEETGVFATGPSGEAFAEGPRITRGVLDDLRSVAAFSAIGEYSPNAVGVADDDQSTQSVYAISSEILPLLGTQPMLGRAFTRDEGLPGRGNAVILGHAFWMSRFGTDSSVIGQALDVRVGAKSIRHTIVGVMPASFTFPPLYTPAFYLPYGSDAARLPPTARVIARVSPGIERAAAEAALRTVVIRHAAADRDAAAADAARFRRATKGQVEITLPSGPVTASVRSYTHEVEGSDSVRRVAALIAIATACILLLAAVNVANLLFARGHARRVEIAVRLALGSTRAGVVGLLLLESALLAGAGAVLGLGLAAAWTASIAPSGPERVLMGAIDFRVAAAALVAALLLLGVFGVIPAMRVSEVRLERVLRDTNRSAATGPSPYSSVISRLLVLSVGFTMLLTVGAGLISTGAARALREMRAAEWDRVVAVRIKFTEPSRSSEFLAGIQHLSGVVAAGFGQPPSNVSPASISAIDSRGVASRLGYFSTAEVSQDFFDVLHLPAPRAVGWSAPTGGPKPIAIDRRTAERLWPAQNAVGRTVRLQINRDSIDEFTVASVVPDRRVLANAAGGNSVGVLYTPFDAATRPRTWLLARLQRGGFETIDSATRSVAARIGGVHVMEVTTLRALAAQHNLFPRIIASAFVLFAVIAVALVALGLYALVVFGVERRRHEIGVRLAVGATRTEVTAMFVRSALGIVAVGVSLGGAVAFVLSPMLSRFVFGISTRAPWVYLGAAAAILLVSLVASVSAGLRASRMHPAAALRVD